MKSDGGLSNELPRVASRLAPAPAPATAALRRLLRGSLFVEGSLFSAQVDGGGERQATASLRDTLSATFHGAQELGCRFLVHPDPCCRAPGARLCAGRRRLPTTHAAHQATPQGWPHAGRAGPPPCICSSGKSTASTGLPVTDGELITALDSQVYKCVESILIVFSKTGNQSVFSDETSTEGTGEYQAPVFGPGRFCADIAVSCDRSVARTYRPSRLTGEKVSFNFDLSVH